MNAVYYENSGITITGAIPTSFSYYVDVTAPATTFLVKVPQAIESGQRGPTFRLTSINAYTFTASPAACTAFVTVSRAYAGGNGMIRLRNAAAGTHYVIAAQYSAASILTKATPNPNTATYTFDAMLGGSAVAGATQTLMLAAQAMTTAPQLPSNGTLHFTATLGGVTSDAGGTAFYRYYTGADAAAALAACEASTSDWMTTTPPPTDPSGGTDAGSDLTVTDGVVPASSAVTGLVEGDPYYWAAFYSGDTNNGRMATSCMPLSVTAPTA